MRLAVTRQPRGSAKIDGIAPDRSLPFAFVDDLDAPELAAADRHHLERVRRLRAGDRLTVGDGRGSYRLVRLGASLDPDGPVEHDPRPDPPVAVGFALTKGDRPELAVQKLTELGVDAIRPFTSARTVVRWDAGKAERHVERWRAIAREAAAQAHRPWLPAVEPVTTLAAVLHDDATGPASLADPDGDAPTLAHPTLLVGPEGGWSPEELESAGHRTRLPGHVLRAETAAIVAGTVLVALRGLDGPPLVRPT